MEFTIEDYNFDVNLGSDMDLTNINFDLSLETDFPTNPTQNKINVIKQNDMKQNDMKPKPILKPSLPTNSNPNKKLEKRVQKRVSYDDMLAQMGMCFNNGRLQKIDTAVCNDDQKCARDIIREYNSKPQKQQEQQKQQQKQQKQQEQQKQQTNANIAINPNLAQQNSYIYNKYFKDQIQTPVQQVVPQTPEEYKQILLQKLLEQRIQKLRVSQMKSTKLIMPTENIHVASQNSNMMNRLFKFSQR
jgi:hypothetical protein